MAGLWNINSIYNVNDKKIFSKLNFELGQVFLAKMIKINDNSTVLLRMLDGWQFSAQVPKQSQINIDGLTKFSVQGLKDGELILKVESDNSSDNSNEAKKNTDPIENLINNEELGVNKDDYKLLKNMIKHNLPLNYKNISKVKTIIDFNIKTQNSPNLENEFIEKYLGSKNINKASAEGKILKNNIKGFFVQLKELNIDDILTLLENGVELNEKNLKSYNAIFKGNGSLYKGIQNIKSQIGIPVSIPNTESQMNIQNSELLDNLQVNTNEPEIKFDGSHHIENKVKTNGVTRNEVSNPKEISETETKQAIRNNQGIEAKNIEIVKNENNNNIEIAKKENNKNNKIVEIVENENDIIVSKSEQKEEVRLENKEKLKLDTAAIIKSQISEKTQDMKTVIKTLIEASSNGSTKSYDNKITDIIKDNISDFKVFNSVSNQYYYLDIPIVKNNYEHQLKLIIKDQREKGKKIDTSNCKIAASISTETMNVVDAYIKINNKSVQINLECLEPYIKNIDENKENLLNEIAGLGYNVHVNVNKKQQQINLSNCSSFFEDNYFSNIDVKV